MHHKKCNANTMLINAGVAPNMMLTINSFSWQYFTLTIFWLPWQQLSNLLTFPGFPEKLSPYVCRLFICSSRLKIPVLFSANCQCHSFPDLCPGFHTWKGESKKMGVFLRPYTCSIQFPYTVRSFLQCRIWGLGNNIDRMLLRWAARITTNVCSPYPIFYIGERTGPYREIG